MVTAWRGLTPIDTFPVGTSVCVVGGPQKGWF